MLARTFITYVAVAALAVVSMTSAAPAPPTIPTVPAVAQIMDGPDFLPVPKEMFPMCCLHSIAACCITPQ
ncbi:hypothetical protein EC957_004723 [Mortierella hygrophila]|uniref:Uncharacterized protein n=1 Tax=Mortierella hygrophila TaxID=979708 RepID=A0A9P6FDX0_9FUNG|nr:hypothetical protein EC957_004723 [Mortierella hygrophila]